MAENASGVEHGQPDVTRRTLLTAAGAVALTAAVTPTASAADHGKVERTFEGESKDGKLQAALENALEKPDKALGEGGVRDGMATWKIAGVSGQRGGFAGFHTTKVTITATRSPDWDKK